MEGKLLRACEALSFSGRKKSRHLKGALQPLFLFFLAGARWTLCFCAIVLFWLCPRGVAWNWLGAVGKSVVVWIVTRVCWIFHGLLAFSLV